jgi:hypothetical protein
LTLLEMHPEIRSMSIKNMTLGPMLCLLAITFGFVLHTLGVYGQGLLDGLSAEMEAFNDSADDADLDSIIHPQKPITPPTMD